MRRPASPAAGGLLAESLVRPYSPFGLNEFGGDIAPGEAHRPGLPNRITFPSGSVIHPSRLP